MSIMIGFISGGELVIVFLVVLLLFGAKSIPDIAKSIGKGMREFNKISNDIKSEINNSEVADTLKDTENSMRRSTVRKTGKTASTSQKTETEPESAATASQSTEAEPESAATASQSTESATESTASAPKSDNTGEKSKG